MNVLPTHAERNIFFSLASSDELTFLHKTGYNLSISKTNINYAAQSLIASLTSSAPFSSDLEELQNILHFPEEVALRLTDAEYQLYYQVHQPFSIWWVRSKSQLYGVKASLRYISTPPMLSVAIEITVDVHRKSQFRLM